MDRMRFEAQVRRYWALCALVVHMSAGCAARQVPPGPDPEYQRPELVPWEGGETAEDPLTNIEDEGEWVDDGADNGGASPTPAQPSPAPSPEPTPQPNPEPSPAPGAEPSPPSSAPNPPPSPAPKTPQSL